MSFSQDEIEEFKAEALELLDTAEKSLLALDQGEEFRPMFDAIFRSFHNLKGASGMMEFHSLQSHTHELENTLMKFKDADSLPKEVIGNFLKGVDTAKSILNGDQPPEKLSDNEIDNGVLSIDEFVTECEEIIERLSKNLQILENDHSSLSTVDALYRDVHSLKGSAYLFSFNVLGNLGHAMESALENVRAGTHQPIQQLFDVFFKSITVIEDILKEIRENKSDECHAPLVTTASQALETVASRLPEAPKVSSPATEPEKASEVITKPQVKERESEGSTSIRVPINLLDNLMTLMGEMVLVRNQVIEYSNKSEDLDFLNMSKRLNVVTSEIQGEMMKTRMQPIGNVFSKFNRVVRDLSQELNKKIQIKISGSETEVDKSLLEALKDPLTHIVRNSCDHGIETPEQRQAAGKNPEGTLTIRAYHEGGQVIVEVQDDGKGLNGPILVEKAIEKGILTPAEAARLSEKKMFNLIFAPGFSTAAKVTNVSGRGVGMDVVQTNIERIGGTVEISSETGKGTTFKIKVPLTLAIVPALTVKCGESTFAIPQVKLEELVRVDQSSEANKIEFLHGSPVLRLRGNILPLVDLNKILKIGNDANYTSDVINIAVLNSENSLFGLIIDRIEDTADIVVKPLNRLLKSLQAFSGATILGDGSVVLILDVIGLAKMAHIGQEKSQSIEESDEKKSFINESQDYLLVKTSSPTTHAFVLGYVHRLEEFKAEDIEYSGDQRVIRYGDTILPLISVNKELGYPTSSEASNNVIPTIVIRRGDAFYGLVVDAILDTLSSTANLDPHHIKNAGIFGNLNTSEELIVVLDPFAIVESAFPKQGPTAQSSPESDTESFTSSPSDSNKTQGARILVAEDTIFFRKMLSSILQTSGYEVVTAIDGQEAIEILNRSEKHFDLIISDIEMPRMNGFQFAKAVRASDRFSKIPLLAVSSRSDSSFMTEGQRAGFDLYMEKLKPSHFLSAVNDLLSKQRDVA